MKRLAILGFGRIGLCIGRLLSSSDDYELWVVDQALSEVAKACINRRQNMRFISGDASDIVFLSQLIKKNAVEGVISCLPFQFNTAIATLCREQNLHYFDLTEDVATQEAIEALSQGAKSAFVPQCGVAPGLIDIIAHHLVSSFDQVVDLRLRVGALPQSIDNPYMYARTWSTEGLVNEYIKPCASLVQGQVVERPGLSDLEPVVIGGVAYEAFNTSGGIGSLLSALSGRVENMNYKTLRYPGHCETMKRLIDQPAFKNNPPQLVEHLNQVIPMIDNDVVVVFVTASGFRDGALIEEQFVRHYYPLHFAHMRFTAIQTVTAIGLVASVDLVREHPDRFQGYIGHECFSLPEILNNRFGRILDDAHNQHKSISQYQGLD